MERVTYPLFPVLCDWRAGRQIIAQFMGLLLLSINQQTIISGNYLFSGMISTRTVNPLQYKSWMQQFKAIYSTFQGLQGEKKYLGSVQEHCHYLVTYLSTVIYSYILKNVNTIAVRESDKVVMMEHEPLWMKRFITSVVVNEQGQLSVRFRPYYEIQELAYGKKDLVGLSSFLCNEQLPPYRGRGRPSKGYVDAKYGVRQARQFNEFNEGV